MDIKAIKSNIRSLLIKTRISHAKNIKIDFSKVSSNISEFISKYFLLYPEYRINCIGGYHPIKNEFPVTPLMQIFGNQFKVQLALPIVIAPDVPLIFKEWKIEDKLEKGQFKVMVPSSSSPLIIPNFFFVTLVGFTSRCNRIGYGGGYYDRTIKEVKEK